MDFALEAGVLISGVDITPESVGLRIGVDSDTGTETLRGGMDIILEVVPVMCGADVVPYTGALGDEAVSPEVGGLISSRGLSPQDEAFESKGAISDESGALITGVDIVPEPWDLICIPPKAMGLVSGVDTPPES